MDRKIFKLPFTKNGTTRFHCPTCSNGYLQIQEGTFFHKESKVSLQDHSHPEWGPEWIRFIYSCIFECNNTACKEVISSTGKGSVDEDYLYDEQGIPEREYN